MILEQDLDEIDQPPAHHPVGGRHRPLLNQRAQRLPLLDVQARASSRRLAADQPARTVRVERHDPVPHRLKPNPAESGSGRARAARIDRRQSQQAPCLGGITRAPGQGAQAVSVKA